MFKQIVENIENRKRRSESGHYNSIPNPFPKLTDYYQGIEKGKYEMVSANTKRGKSHFTDFFYVYHPVLFTMNNTSDLNVTVEYLSLEMTKEQKIMQAMCHFLYIDSGGQVRVTPKDLRSIEKPLDREILDTINKYEPFFIKYLDRVNYHDNIRTCEDIAKFTHNLCQKIDPRDESIKLLILDHASLITEQKGQTKKQAIDFVSNSVFLKARNEYRLNPVIVQQQANDKDSLEAKKANDILPSFGGLADSKDTARDIDMAFGIFSPQMANMSMYQNINVSKHGDNLRIINTMGGRESSGLVEIAVYFDGGVSYFKQM